MDLQANRLRTGQMFPNIALQDEHGRAVRTSDYRHRKNLVVVFSGEPVTAGFKALLDEIAGRYADFQFEDAEVLAIIAGARPELSEVKAGRELPFPLLLDPGGEAHRQAGATGAGGQPSFTVAVLDRYCEIYAAFPVTEDERPEVQSLIEWLEYIELQCDE